MAVEGAETPIEAAVAFAERTGDGGVLSIVVIDCETRRSLCVVIDLESGEVGAC